MYSGRVQIWNYSTQSVVKTLDVSQLPVRCGKFVARKNWIIIGSDDYNIRVFNYNTGEKVIQFEAHPDYIRTIAVHPTQPFLITGSDDMTIKLWNWDEHWKNTRVFEGHTHYIMYLAFNPKDTNTFASACLDRTVKIWSLGSSYANFTIEAHSTNCVNFVEYYPHADKPYLVTSSDDRTIKVWDYQTKSCVATMAEHTHNVSFAIFHPEMPLIISGSEDCTVKIWNANTYRLEQSINYGLERVWAAAARPGSNLIALGFDAGAITIQMGKDEPAVSMDRNGRVVWAKHSEIQSGLIRVSKHTVTDGQIINLEPSNKEPVQAPVFVSQVVHSPDGRFVAAAGDGEYMIYTALKLNQMSYGNGTCFVWSSTSREYAVLDQSQTVRTYFKKGVEKFEERVRDVQLLAPGPITNLYGGALLGVGCASCVRFFDWESGTLVRQIDLENANQVVWSDAGDLVVISSEEAFYVLRFDRDAFLEWTGEEGDCEQALELSTEISDSLKTGKWAGDCFVYTTSNRLHYLVGNETYTLTHFDHQMYVLGYVANSGAVFVADKDLTVMPYKLSLDVITYQTLVLRGDLEGANEILPKIPESELTKLARFLEAQGYVELALEMTRDQDHEFDLSLRLNRLDIAERIAHDDAKWKLLGDKALEQWNVELAQTCFEKASDFESLLLVHTSTGDHASLKELAVKASEVGKYNIAFNALWHVGEVQQCVDLLNKTNRHAEAALLATTYGIEVSVSVTQWKQRLEATGRGKIASALGDELEVADVA